MSYQSEAQHPSELLLLLLLLRMSLRRIKLLVCNIFYSPPVY